MKVVHATSVHGARDVRIFEKMCRSLARAGAEVVLVAPATAGGVVDGVRIEAVAPPRSRAWRLLVTSAAVLRRALRERPDLLHVHDPELLPAAHVARLLGRRVIYDMHENLPVSIEAKEWIPRRLRRPVERLWRGLESALLAGLPVVFAEASYRRSYPAVRVFEEIRNLPLLGELGDVDEPRHETNAVVYVGRVSASRGSLVTLDALAALRRRGLDVRFDCIGPADPRHHAALVERAAALGLGDRVALHGWLPAHEAWRLAARAHVGLAVLRAEPNYVESPPTKMFEYMALGLVAVVSDFPSYREIVERTGGGVCVPPESAEALADALEALFRDPPRRAAIAARGRESVRRLFDWNAEAAKLVRFYERVLAL